MNEVIVASEEKKVTWNGSFFLFPSVLSNLVHWKSEQDTKGPCLVRIVTILSVQNLELYEII